MQIDKTKAVLNEDGTVKSFILEVGGKPFNCQCQANCFHKPFKESPGIYRCNSCGMTYKDASNEN